MKNKTISIPPKLAAALSYLMLALLPVGFFFIVEFGYNMLLSFWTRMTIQALAVNYVWYALLTVCVYCFFRRPRAALTVLTLLVLVYAAANHFVAVLKGAPITAADFRAMKTAVAVMGDYDYTPDIFLLKSIVTAAWTILGIILFVRPPVDGEKKGKRIKAAAGAASAVCLLLLSLNMGRFLSDVTGTELYHGDMSLAYERNGYIPVTLSGIKSLKPEKPENYSADLTKAILERYAAPSEPSGKQQPMIIGIMNETFSDLSVLGPVENQGAILDCLYSLKEDPNTIAWGSCLVSVRGTGTANSEFEFLTGDTLRFCGIGTPYNDSMRNVPNLASNLKAEGYYTIAMHPENATNWRRNGVYPEFGFDEFLSYADFKGYDTISDEADVILNSDDEKTTGGRISDLGDYKKLIDVLEAQESPAFLFNVTMQNHSGYNKLNERVTAHPVDSDPVLNTDEEARTYETLIALSDDAIEYLIDYLRDYDRPVILVLFGDHQPALSDSIVDALKSRRTEGSPLEKSETEYLTQYFIWSNYDTGIKYTSADIVSANYLGAMVRKAAGCTLTAFEEYLLAQMEEIPAMNRFGYLGNDGAWHDYDEESPYSGWIDGYELIQYNNLYDKESNADLFHLSS